MRDNAFFALKGHVHRTMEHGLIDGMIISESPKKS